MEKEYRQALGEISCCVHRVPETQELKLNAITLSAGFDNDCPYCSPSFEVLTRLYPCNLLLSGRGSFNTLRDLQLSKNSKIFLPPNAQRNAIEYWYSLQVICGLKPLKQARNQAFLTPSCQCQICDRDLYKFC